MCGCRSIIERAAARLRDEVADGEHFRHDEYRQHEYERGKDISERLHTPFRPVEHFRSQIAAIFDEVPHESSRGLR